MITRFCEWWIGDVIIEAKYGIFIAMIMIMPTMFIITALSLGPWLLLAAWLTGAF
jgi:hypothetical protein